MWMKQAKTHDRSSGWQRALWYQDCEVLIGYKTDEAVGHDDKNRPKQPEQHLQDCPKQSLHCNATKPVGTD